LVKSTQRMVRAWPTRNPSASAKAAAVNVPARVASRWAWAAVMSPAASAAVAAGMVRSRRANRTPPGASSSELLSAVASQLAVLR
jgi:hypothetical protein